MGNSGRLTENCAKGWMDFSQGSDIFLWELSEKHLFLFGFTRF